MHPRITGVEVISPYTLNLRFADGTGGLVDCSHLVLREDAGVFAALRDPKEFAKAYVHPEANTVGVAVHPLVTAVQVIPPYRRASSSRTDRQASWMRAHGWREAPVSSPISGIP
jgi:hypothetical protein